MLSTKTHLLVLSFNNFFMKCTWVLSGVVLHCYNNTLELVGTEHVVYLGGSYGVPREVPNGSNSRYGLYIVMHRYLIGIIIYMSYVFLCCH